VSLGGFAHELAGVVAATATDGSGGATAAVTAATAPAGAEASGAVSAVLRAVSAVLRRPTATGGTTAVGTGGRATAVATNLPQSHRRVGGEGGGEG